MLFIELLQEAELPENQKYNPLTDKQTSMGVTSMLKNKKLTEKGASRNGANHVYKIMFIFCRYITGSRMLPLRCKSCSGLLCLEIWVYPSDKKMTHFDVPILLEIRADPYLTLQKQVESGQRMVLVLAKGPLRRHQRFRTSTCFSGVPRVEG
jgi:hypothetical protein